MAKRTRYKAIVEDLKLRDPDFGFFFNSEARVSDTIWLDWESIYAIFDSDDFSEF